MDQNTDTQSTNTTSNGSGSSNAGAKPFPVSGQAASASTGTSKPQEDDSTVASIAASAAPVAEGLIQRVAQRAHDAVDGVAASLSSTVDGLQGGVSKAGDTRDEWVESTRDAIRKHPFAAVGTAVLIGLALRSLSSTRDR